jgi:hypothetical protein
MPEQANTLVSLELSTGEWAEELAAISKRRNLFERSMRTTIAGAFRFGQQANKTKDTPKKRVLSSLDAKRRAQLDPFRLEEILERLYFLEVKVLVEKNWPDFEQIFGDHRAFEQNMTIVNDRPDTHAKALDLADVALQRRAMDWLEERLAKLD